MKFVDIYTLLNGNQYIEVKDFTGHLIGGEIYDIRSNSDKMEILKKHILRDVIDLETYKVVNHTFLEITLK